MVERCGYRIGLVTPIDVGITIDGNRQHSGLVRPDQIIRILAEQQGFIHFAAFFQKGAAEKK